MKGGLYTSSDRIPIRNDKESDSNSPSALPLRHRGLSIDSKEHKTHTQAEKEIEFKNSNNSSFPPPNYQNLNLNKHRNVKQNSTAATYQNSGESTFKKGQSKSPNNNDHSPSLNDQNNSISVVKKQTKKYIVSSSQRNINKSKTQFQPQNSNLNKNGEGSNQTFTDYTQVESQNFQTHKQTPQNLPQILPGQASLQSVKQKKSKFAAKGLQAQQQRISALERVGGNQTPAAVSTKQIIQNLPQSLDCQKFQCSMGLKKQRTGMIVEKVKTNRLSIKKPTNVTGEIGQPRSVLDPQNNQEDSNSNYDQPRKVGVTNNVVTSDYLQDNAALKNNENASLNQSEQIDPSSFELKQSPVMDSHIRKNSFKRTRARNSIKQTKSPRGEIQKNGPPDNSNLQQESNQRNELTLDQSEKVTNKEQNLQRNLNLDRSLEEITLTLQQTNDTLHKLTDKRSHDQHSDEVDSPGALQPDSATRKQNNTRVPLSQKRLQAVKKSQKTQGVVASTFLTTDCIKMGQQQAVGRHSLRHTRQNFLRQKNTTSIGDGMPKPSLPPPQTTIQQSTERNLAEQKKQKGQKLVKKSNFGLSRAPAHLSTARIETGSKLNLSPQHELCYGENYQNRGVALLKQSLSPNSASRKKKAASQNRLAPLEASLSFREEQKNLEIQEHDRQHQSINLLPNLTSSKNIKGNATRNDQDMQNPYQDPFNQPLLSPIQKKSDIFKPNQTNQMPQYNEQAQSQLQNQQQTPLLQQQHMLTNYFITSQNQHINSNSNVVVPLVVGQDLITNQRNPFRNDIQNYHSMQHLPVNQTMKQYENHQQHSEIHQIQNEQSLNSDEEIQEEKITTGGVIPIIVTHVGEFRGSADSIIQPTDIGRKQQTQKPTQHLKKSEENLQNFTNQSCQSNNNPPQQIKRFPGISGRQSLLLSKLQEQKEIPLQILSQVAATNNISSTNNLQLVAEKQSTYASNMTDSRRRNSKIGQSEQVFSYQKRNNQQDPPTTLVSYLNKSQNNNDQSVQFGRNTKNASLDGSDRFSNHQQPQFANEQLQEDNKNDFRNSHYRQEEISNKLLLNQQMPGSRSQRISMENIASVPIQQEQKTASQFDIRENSMVQFSKNSFEPHDKQKRSVLQVIKNGVDSINNSVDQATLLKKQSNDRGSKEIKLSKKTDQQFFNANNQGKHQNLLNPTVPAKKTNLKLSQSPTATTQQSRQEDTSNVSQHQYGQIIRQNRQLLDYTNDLDSNKTLANSLSTQALLAENGNTGQISNLQAAKNTSTTINPNYTSSSKQISPLQSAQLISQSMLEQPLDLINLQGSIPRHTYRSRVLPRNSQTNQPQNLPNSIEDPLQSLNSLREVYQSRGNANSSSQNQLEMRNTNSDSLNPFGRKFQRWIHAQIGQRKQNVTEMGNQIVRRGHNNNNLPEHLQEIQSRNQMDKVVNQQQEWSLLQQNGHQKYAQIQGNQKSSNRKTIKQLVVNRGDTWSQQPDHNQMVQANNIKRLPFNMQQSQAQMLGSLVLKQQTQKRSSEVNESADEIGGATWNQNKKSDVQFEGQFVENSRHHRVVHSLAQNTVLNQNNYSYAGSKYKRMKQRDFSEKFSFETPMTRDASALLAPDQSQSAGRLPEIFNIKRNFKANKAKRGSGTEHMRSENANTKQNEQREEIVGRNSNSNGPSIDRGAPSYIN